MASTSPAVQGTPTPVVVTRNRMGRRRWIAEIGWRHVVGVIAVVYAAFPLVYVISASLSENGTLTGSNRLFGAVSTVNFAELGDTYFWTWMGNSLVIATTTGIGTVLMGAAACLLYTSPSPRDGLLSRMPSSA